MISNYVISIEDEGGFYRGRLEDWGEEIPNDPAVPSSAVSMFNITASSVEGLMASAHLSIRTRERARRGSKI